MVGVVSVVPITCSLLPAPVWLRLTALLATAYFLAPALPASHSTGKSPQRPQATKASPSLAGAHFEVFLTILIKIHGENEGNKIESESGPTVTVWQQAPTGEWIAVTTSQ